MYNAFCFCFGKKKLLSTSSISRAAIHAVLSLFNQHQPTFFNMFNLVPSLIPEFRKFRLSARSKKQQILSASAFALLCLMSARHAVWPGQAKRKHASSHHFFSLFLLAFAECQKLKNALEL